MHSQESRNGRAGRGVLGSFVRMFSGVARAGDQVAARAGAQFRAAMGHPLRPFPLAHVAGTAGAASQALSAQESLAMREQYPGLGIAGLPPATLQHAHRFLTLLPTWLPMPETRRHGHGQVALEWSGNDARRFSVLIGQDGMLIYSARLGPKGRLDGAEPIANQLSPIVTHVIRQLQA
jgi:hypothetical protein